MSPKLPETVTCPECGRVFNLLAERDAEEWAFGHDCEAPLDNLTTVGDTAKANWPVDHEEGE